jgi:hypothetical protein
MTRENVEVIQRLVEVFNGLSHYADDVEFRLIGGFSDLTGRRLKGREARRWRAS